MARGIGSSMGLHDNSVWPKYVQERVASAFTAFGVGVVFTGGAATMLVRAVRSARPIPNPNPRNPCAQPHPAAVRLCCRVR
jgi:hypothetical protein